MITIKNSKGQVCDYRVFSDIDITESVENIQKLINECIEKMNDVTGIPKELYDKKCSKS